MDAVWPYYTLPSSPEYKCVDRFDVLESDEPEVPFWEVLNFLLRRRPKDVTELVDILETIALTARGTAPADYEQLATTLAGHGSFFDSTWPAISALALELPELFPGHYLHVLCAGHPTIKLSRRQTACLIVHQFLCTLKRPSSREDFFDFSIWYPSEQPHASASQIYLTSILTYFERIAHGDIDISPGWNIEYNLKYALEFPLDVPVSKLRISCLDQDSTAPQFLGLPDGACVISANRVVGFGQSGTQEERHVAASPEACPLVLIAPVLGDSEAFVVRGAEAMISIRGHGRQISLAEVLQSDTNCENHSQLWQARTMLFLDALELDVEPGILPDLLEGNVDREFRKALAGFASGPYVSITTGFWGCGAFGGNPAIKSVVQWCAASVAKSELHFICSGEEQATFGADMEAFVNFIQARNAQVRDLMDCLRRLQPGDLDLDSSSGMNQPIFDALRIAMSFESRSP